MERIEQMKETPSSEPILIFLGYLDALIKRWLPVTLFVLICAIVVGVISFRMTPSYEITATIEPGVIGKDSYNRILYNETAENLANKVRRGAYTNSVFTALRLNPKEENVKFTTRYLSKEQSVVVSFVTTKIELGKKIMRELINQISLEKKVYINNIRAEYDVEIGMKENMIKNLEGEIKKVGESIALQNNEILGLGISQKDTEQDIKKQQITLEEIKISIETINVSIRIKENEKDSFNKKIESEDELIGLLNKRIEEVNKQVDEVKDNTNGILKERQKVLETEVAQPTDALSMLLYTTTIQQSIAYFNSLQDQLHSLRTEVEEHKRSIEDFQKEIKNLDEEITTLKIKRDKTLENDKKTVETDIEKLKIVKDESIPKEITERKIQIAKLELEKTVTLVAQINDAKQEIEGLKIEKEMVYPLKVIQEPTSSIYPVKPKKKMNVLAAIIASLAFVCSLVILEHTYRIKSK